MTGSKLLLIVLAIAVVGGVIALGSQRSYPGAATEAVAPSAPAYEPRFTADDVAYVTQPVRQQIELGAFPGSALALGVRDQELVTLGLGHIGWTRNAAPVDPDSTIYDLASLTKVLATASAVLLLADEGRLSLDDPMSRFLPEFADGPKSEVTFRHVLTHTSGLPAGAILRGDDRGDRLARAAGFSIYPPAGAREEYSDIGYVLLWVAAERAAGKPLQEYLARRLYGPLGMASTGFMPGLDCERCAPTGRLRDQSLYRGQPFDPIAQRLDGIGGSAGLFSTASDVGRFMAMLTAGGELDGVRVLSPEAVREFVRVQTPGNEHGLGWEVGCRNPREEESEEEQGCAVPRSIGHTGWTGTSLRIDVETGTWVVLLTNRTYEPRAPNRLGAVRREVFARAVEIARGASPEPEATGTQ
jgi:serine-type D-Ala-D-Ala carboxypeptidase